MVIVTPDDNGTASFERLLETITPESVRLQGKYNNMEVASIFIKTHAARNDEPHYWTLKELRAECKQLGLRTDGVRNQLLARLPPRSIEETPNIKMPNGASDWSVEEYEKMVMKVVKSVIYAE